jgi:hypothetical protein
MHSTELVREIYRLLCEGQLSQRQIAARLGVSRGTVGAIASGRRGLKGKVGEGGASHAHVARCGPVRCCVCGYRVYKPCRICLAREYRRQQLSGIEPSPDGTLKRSVRARSRAD